MIAVSVIGADKVAANLERAARELPGAMERSISRTSVETRNELHRQMSNTQRRDAFFGAVGGSAPGLGARTGGSRNRLSPGGRVFRRGDQVFSAVGSPDKHVAFAEEGGTITGNQYLRIPLAAAQSPSGAEKGEFVGRSLRDVPGVFLKRSKGGRLFAVRQRGKRLLEFTHMLVRLVTRPARHTFQTVKERMAPRATVQMDASVNLVTRRANG